MFSLIKSPRIASAALAAALVLGAATPSAQAHFMVLHVGDQARMPGQPLDMMLLFTHAFSGGPSMNLDEPADFYAMHRNGARGMSKRIDLAEKLEPVAWTDDDGREATAFKMSLDVRDIRGMGDYVFSYAPEPYFETEEDIYIQQFTKLVVNVGGVPGNWHEDLMMPAEIRPLNKPYANWVGGVFRGVVISEGQPVPNAELEIEYLPRLPDAETGGWTGEPQLTAPHPSLEAQTIVADANGQFQIGLPKAGYWGIAALGVGPQRDYNGKTLSQDAILWVQAVDVE